MSPQAKTTRSGRYCDALEKFGCIYRRLLCHSPISYTSDAESKTMEGNLRIRIREGAKGGTVL